MSNPHTKYLYESYNHTPLPRLFGPALYGRSIVKLHDSDAFVRLLCLPDWLLILLFLARYRLKWITNVDCKAWVHWHPMNCLPIRPGLPFG